MDEMIILKWVLETVFVLAQDRVIKVGFFEHGNECSHSLKAGIFLDI
jgi:hypothetical protein